MALGPLPSIAPSSTSGQHRAVRLVAGSHRGARYEEWGDIICRPREGKAGRSVSESPAPPGAPPGAVLPRAARCKTEPEGFAGLVACSTAV